MLIYIRDKKTKRLSKKKGIYIYSPLTNQIVHPGYESFLIFRKLILGSFTDLLCKETAQEKQEKSKKQKTKVTWVYMECASCLVLYTLVKLKVDITDKILAIFEHIFDQKQLTWRNKRYLYNLQKHHQKHDPCQPFVIKKLKKWEV